MQIKLKRISVSIAVSVTMDGYKLQRHVYLLKSVDKTFPVKGSVVDFDAEVKRAPVWSGNSRKKFSLAASHDYQQCLSLAGSGDGTKVCLRID